MSPGPDEEAELGPARAESIPIRRRLILLTVLGAAGGALFTPFVTATATVPSPPVVLVVFILGSGIVTGLAAFFGLRWADRARLPMPLLHRWELPLANEPVAWATHMLVPVNLAATLGFIASISADLLGVPDNPRSLVVRIATTPFAAVIPEVVVHLFLMSGLVLLLGRVWPAITLSTLVFVLMFHGDPSGNGTTILLFVVGLNTTLGMLTGWVFYRWGFTAAMLAHAVAHFIVLAAG